MGRPPLVFLVQGLPFLGPVLVTEKSPEFQIDPKKTYFSSWLARFFRFLAFRFFLTPLKSTLKKIPAKIICRAVYDNNIYIYIYI